MRLDDKCLAAHSRLLVGVCHGSFIFTAAGENARVNLVVLLDYAARLGKLGSIGGSYVPSIDWIILVEIVTISEEFA